MLDEKKVRLKGTTTITSNLLREVYREDGKVTEDTFTK
jgi:hypothetical protein